MHSIIMGTITIAKQFSLSDFIYINNIGLLNQCSVCKPPLLQNFLRHT